MRLRLPSPHLRLSDEARLGWEERVIQRHGVTNWYGCSFLSDINNLPLKGNTNYLGQLVVGYDASKAN